MALKSSLGNIQPEPFDAEKVKRAAWVDDGILVVKMIDDRVTAIERQILQKIGERLYGAKGALCR